MENEKILDDYNIDNYDITALICKLAGIKDNKNIADIDEVIYMNNLECVTEV